MHDFQQRKPLFLLLFVIFSMSVRGNYVYGTTTQKVLHIELNSKLTLFVKDVPNIGTLLVLMLCRLPQASPHYNKIKKQ